MKTLMMQYIEAKNIRMELQKFAEKLKNREEEIKNIMILKMQSKGIKSLKIEGMGQCTKKEKFFYDIIDYDKFADTQALLINECAASGAPRIDGTLLQKTVCASRVDELLDRTQPDDEEEFLSSIGLRKCSRTELSITK